MIELIAALQLLGQPAELKIEWFSGLDEKSVELGCADLTSGVVIKGPKEFGGYSGMIYGPEAGELTLLSDRSHLLEARLIMGEDGSIGGLAVPARIIPLTTKNGGSGQDTEAIARSPDGGFLISRERTDDVIHVDRIGDGYQVTKVVIDLSVTGDWPRNGGFEAMARMPDGGLLLIPETRDQEHRAPFFYWDGQAVHPGALFQGEKDFAVTEIAIDDKTGRVFVLERAFDRRLGPRARVTTLPLSEALDRDGVAAPKEIARMTLFEGADNMEAMAFFKAVDGSPRLLLASDDNFNDIQRTVLMSLSLSRCDLSAAKP